MCLSKVIMMCGVCGSGKTTYAKKKEQEGYIRLSIDGAIDKPCGESVRSLTQKHVAKRYMIAEKLLSLHHE